MKVINSIPKILKREFPFLLALVIVSILPFSNIGFWGDEAWTAYQFGLAESFSSLLKEISGALGGDAQFPGYNINIWLWMQLFPNKEIIIRYSNLPLFILMLLYLRYSIPGSISFKLGYIAVLCFNPLVWYYLNEARYPIMVLSTAAISLFSLISFFEGRNERSKLLNAVIFSISLIYGVSLIMLYFFFIPTLTVIGLYYTLQKRVVFVNKKIWILISLQVIFLVLIGGYYIFTIHHGSGGQRQKPSVLNIVFAFYEHLGYLGIGPARNALRAAPTLDTLKPFLIPLTFLTTIYVLVLILIMKKISFKKNMPEIVGLLGLAVGLIFFYIGAAIFNFKFLGRHNIFFYIPLSFYIYSLFYKNVLREKRRIGIAISLIILGIYIFSCINIRFVSYYQKEDYRKAATLSKSYARFYDSDIIWYAENNSGKYYNIEDTNSDSPITVKYIAGSSKKCANDIMHDINGRNIVLILCRNDYDSELDKNLKQNNYEVLYSDKDFKVYGNSNEYQ